ncbi:MAG TPA: hypothetical protein VGN20_12310 [Mucilaginibacter sp.]|jgi:hypothetical protein
MSKKSPKVGKSESPEDTEAEDKPAIDKSDPHSYRDENHIRNKRTTHNSPLTNMEVHHHPEVEKKGLKEYILEGLMIFLAVTMGFFAETIREHISEKAKGLEYIKSFAQDLRRDTANFSRLIAYDQTKAAALNSLASCSDAIKKKPGNASCLVPIIKVSLSNRNVSFTNGTMQQLKNAGGFRLLNETDKDSIMAYDYAQNAYLDFQATIFQESQDNLRNTFQRLWNFDADAMLSLNPPQKVGKTPLLFSNDKALTNQFFNNLFFYNRVNNAQMSTLNKTKEHAVRLIRYFENKYDLKNE